MEQRAAAIDRARVAALGEERLDWRFKAVPAQAWGLTVREYLATGPTLDQLATPLLTLDAGALAHNLRTMADWCAHAEVELAPHGKTTMAPALWQAQLEAGRLRHHRGQPAAAAGGQGLSGESGDARQHAARSGRTGLAGR